MHLRIIHFAQQISSDWEWNSPLLSCLCIPQVCHWVRWVETKVDPRLNPTRVDAMTECYCRKVSRLTGERSPSDQICAPHYRSLAPSQDPPTALPLFPPAYHPFALCLRATRGPSDPGLCQTPSDPKVLVHTSPSAHQDLPPLMAHPYSSASNSHYQCVSCCW